MTDYLITSTSEADEHARAADEWWRQHRSVSPDLFLTELARAFSLLAQMPKIGARYEAPGASPDIRRLLMRSLQTHVYYSVDSVARVVTIRAIWHSARGHGPF